MTALAATYQPGTAFRAPRVLLQVTGAPNPPANAYASNFATTDGWTGASAAIVLGNLRLSGSVGQPAGTVTTGQRTLTGLSIGVQYRYRAFITTQSDTQARLRLSGGVSSAYVATLAAGAWVELLFTATATSHVIMVDLKNTVANSGPIVDVTTVTVQPSGTWQGTTIRRSDINGTAVVVREDAGGMDVSGGTMTLYDSEAALIGPVFYTVTDGTGATANAVTSLSTGAVVNWIPDPGFELSAVSWQAQGTGTTIDRSGADSDTGAGSGLLVTGTTNGLALRTVTMAPDNPVGKTWGLRWRVKSLEAVPVDVSIALRFIQADGATSVSTVTAAPVTLQPGVWTTLSMTAVVPALTVFIRAQFNKLDASVRSFRVDSVLTREVAGAFDPADYFDGSTLGAIWTGSPHNSPSVRTDDGETAVGVWLTVPASSTPSVGLIPAVGVLAVTEYAEDSQSNGSLHQIVGRADPIANPGPLALRAGTFDILCTSYLAADAVRQLVAQGDVAQLRQPTHEGLDLYFVAQSVRIAPAPEVSSPRRWVASVQYAEVLAV